MLCPVFGHRCELVRRWAKAVGGGLIVHFRGEPNVKTGFLLSVFDMVDVGDVDVVQQAAERTDRVVAQVLSDDAVVSLTGRKPVVPAIERVEIVGAMRQVADAAIFDPAGPLKSGPRDVVYGRTDVSVGTVPVDKWLEPRQIVVPSDELGQTARLSSTGGVLGYVPGAWDRFHIGHLNLLKRARQHCQRLVVGVVTDDALFQAKGKYPMVPLRERMQVVAAMDIVDAVVVDFSSSKLAAWNQVHFDVLFKGDDWQGTPKGNRLEAEMASVGASVHYFPYTAHTSSTALRQILASR
ncbi:adenylyltransferase/cytidyltransferase family protein [Micropruina sp.]|uniref:adenylyltransferase/cytidyltransferase family protein n=1 Tax=Micropruina sp. TaxID=2737536 RepID=UPI0039E58ACF